MDNVLSEEQRIKREREEREWKKKQRKDKIQSYAKYVKEIHWPELSAQKMRELEDLKYKQNEKKFTKQYLRVRGGGSLDHSPNRSHS